MTRVTTAMMAAVLVAGCGEAPVANENIAANVVAATPLAAPTPAEPAATRRPKPAPDSAEAAVAVVQRYYAAIDRRRYAQAYALREPGVERPSEEAFAADFARYASHHAEVGAPGRIDSGAGQRYVTIPVRVFGKTRDGAAFAETGEVVLHHAADIDGATAEQRRWRIRSIELKPA